VNVVVQPAFRGGDQTRNRSQSLVKAFHSCPNHIAHTSYLKRVRNRLQVSIEGSRALVAASTKPTLAIYSINKGL
jgi:hypothetical protein